MSGLRHWSSMKFTPLDRNAQANLAAHPASRGWTGADVRPERRRQRTGARPDVHRGSDRQVVEGGQAMGPRSPISARAPAGAPAGAQVMSEEMRGGWLRVSADPAGRRSARARVGGTGVRLLGRAIGGRVVSGRPVARRPVARRPVRRRPVRRRRLLGGPLVGGPLVRGPLALVRGPLADPGGRSGAPEPGPPGKSG